MSWCQWFAVVRCWGYGREGPPVQDPFDVDEGRLKDFGVEWVPQGHSGHVALEKSHNPFPTSASMWCAWRDEGPLDALSLKVIC